MRLSAMPRRGVPVSVGGECCRPVLQADLGRARTPCRSCSTIRRLARSACSALHPQAGLDPATGQTSIRSRCTGRGTAAQLILVPRSPAHTFFVSHRCALWRTIGLASRAGRGGWRGLCSHGATDAAHGPAMFSVELVQAATPEGSRETEVIDCQHLVEPSSMRGGDAGCLVEPAGEIAQQSFGFVGIVELPSLPERPAQLGVQRLAGSILAPGVFWAAISFGWIPALFVAAEAAVIFEIIYRVATGTMLGDGNGPISGARPGSESTLVPCCTTAIRRCCAIDSLVAKCPDLSRSWLPPENTECRRPYPSTVKTSGSTRGFTLSNAPLPLTRLSRGACQPKYASIIRR
jgi:hypothetical protein